MSLAVHRPRARDVRSDLGAVGLLTALAAAVRFGTLSRQSLWFDEAVTVARVLKPGLPATLSAVADGESSPPLYYVMAWAWAHGFGTGAVGIRSLSAVAGTLTVPVAWGVGRALGGSRAGVVLGALVAVSPLYVWYSQEARAYALLVLLAALSFLFFLRALENPRPRLVAGWALASSLALCTHYFAVFVILPEALWLLARRPSRRPALAGVAAVAAVAAALAPLAIAQRHPIRIAWITQRPLGARMADTLASPFVGGSDAPLRRVAAVGALVAAAGMAAVLPRLSAQDVAAAGRGLVVGAAALAIPVAIAVAGPDLIAPRNLIAIWLPLGAAPAVLLGTPRAGRRGAVATGVLCAFGLAVVAAVALQPRLQRGDWRDVGRVLGAADRPRAIVAPYVGLVPLQWYLPGSRRLAGPATRRIAELDLVGWAGTRRRAVRAPSGFRLDGSWRVGALVVLRLRTAHPQELTGRRLLALRLNGGHAAVLAARPKAARP